MPLHAFTQFEVSKMKTNGFICIKCVVLAHNPTTWVMLITTFVIT